MKLIRVFLAFLLWCIAGAAQTASPTVLLTPDDRLKADILLVVAHPDDETGVIPYLAQVLDEHKRVAVVYLTHGEAGHNNMGPERAQSLGAAREMELRHALVAMGIQNVWFLSGRDTPGQNVLQSLANWRHGVALEEMVRMVRLTRPEVILTWQPGFFIGENHGDHQAAGVVATEAFDLAGDRSAFPAQLAGPTRINETLLDGLQPWQAKKIYYFPDSADHSIFANTGPTYPSTAISPTRKLPYWRIAMDTFRFHLTQYRNFIERIGKLDETQLAAQVRNWGQPVELTLGKSHVGGTVTGDVFEGTSSGPLPFIAVVREPAPPVAPLSVELGGPWSYYEEFRRAHGLTHLPKAVTPQISIKKGSTLLVPLTLRNYTDSAQTVQISVTTPEGWTNPSGTGSFLAGPQGTYYLQVMIDSPKTESGSSQKIQCRVEGEGKTLASITLDVRVASGGLPQ